MPEVLVYRPLTASRFSACFYPVVGSLELFATPPFLLQADPLLPLVALLGSNVMVRGLIPAAKGEHGVEPAEGETVRESVFNLGATGLVREHVEVALEVRFGEVGRGRQKAVLQRQDRGDRFDRAGGAQGVAVHRLGRADREPIGVGTKDGADGAGFHGIS